MNGRMPVIASVECWSQFSWRAGIGITIEKVADLVGIFPMHAVERQTGKTLGQPNVKSIHFLATSEIVNLCFRSPQKHFSPQEDTKLPLGSLSHSCFESRSLLALPPCDDWFVGYCSLPCFCFLV